MTGNSTTQQKPPSPAAKAEPQASLRWYFVCPACNAKWFHTLPRHPCPRCGTMVAAGDRVVPPWRQ